MDKTIIFSQLSHTVAELTQCTDADAETFLRELFALAAEQLGEDGETTVPGLGRFVITSDAVAFIADRDLADAINAPFAAFEPVELPADDDEEAPEPEAEAEEAPAEPAAAASDGEMIASAAEFEEESDAVPPAYVAPAVPEAEPLPEEQPAQEPAETVRRRSYGWLLWLVACGLCFVAGWIAGSLRAPATDAAPLAPADSVAVVAADTVKPCETEPTVAESEPEPAVVEPVTDTITSSRFLTTMARAHYGQMDYWVYIYEENADKLGHPDRLEAGTVVVIPPAEKYGLVAGDEEKIKEASRKATEIYGRFN